VVLLILHVAADDLFEAVKFSRYRLEDAVNKCIECLMNLMFLWLVVILKIHE
jgi:hypothetical protein